MEYKIELSKEQLRDLISVLDYVLDSQRDDYVNNFHSSSNNDHVFFKALLLRDKINDIE